MHPTELQAYKLKIENSGIEVLNDTLRQIVTLGEFPNELLPAVISSLQKSRYIESRILCDILVSVHAVLARLLAVFTNEGAETPLK
jgi:hypothetical protein